ncbi:MAG: hypothetical protein J6Y02_12950 [Pseudobutyrivibrio sp.]|nr:hypothetical protein [Pseudobutyrivibrio sp.]
MKKTIFAIVALVAIISSVLTVVVLRTYEAHSDDISDMRNEVAYRVNAKEIHNEAIRVMDEDANARHFTGIEESTATVGSDVLTWSACYINGKRVSAEEYNDWILEITDKYNNAINEADETIEEQENRLNNITLADWFNCKFDR